jgi:hypothetical protein
MPNFNKPIWCTLVGVQPKETFKSRLYRAVKDTSKKLIMPSLVVASVTLMGIMAEFAKPGTQSFK